MQYQGSNLPQQTLGDPKVSKLFSLRRVFVTPWARLAVFLINHHNPRAATVNLMLFSQIGYKKCETSSCYIPNASFLIHAVSPHSPSWHPHFQPWAHGTFSLSDSVLDRKRPTIAISPMGILDRSLEFPVQIPTPFHCNSPLRRKEKEEEVDIPVDDETVNCNPPPGHHQTSLGNPHVVRLSQSRPLPAWSPVDRH